MWRSEWWNKGWNGSRVRVAAGVLLLLSAGPSRAEKKVPAQADLILLSGDIWTLDRAHPRAQALAIAGDRIVAVGTDAEIDRLAPSAKRIRLGGRTVLPAFTDAHAHLYGLGLSLGRLDLRDCASPRACAEKVGQTVAAGKGTGAGEWILGRGWDQNRWETKQFPTHETLDAVAAGHPVWLRRIDGHAGWASARALERAGIGAKTADPPGGRILHGRDGKPTGVLVDEAMDLVEKTIPPPSATVREQAILAAQAKVLEQGLTEIHEMGIDRETVAAYERLLAQGKLFVRVYAFAEGSVWGQQALEQPPAPQAQGARFALRGIKLYVDGALGSRGAALLAPYQDDPKNVGLVITPKEEIERVARLALQKGWQVAVHAIGDRGVRTVLDAFEAAGCAKSHDHRFRIEHAQVVAPADFVRFAQLGVLASVQPAHAVSDMGWAEARLGPERVTGAYAWRHFLAAGARVVGGSDFPVERVDPIAGGLHASITRQDADGKPPGGWLPAERLTLEEAVEAITQTASYGAFQEGWRGRAVPGQVADLTILDRALPTQREPAAKALLSTRVAMTLVGGQVVFDRAPGL